MHRITSVVVAQMPGRFGVQPVELVLSTTGAVNAGQRAASAQRQSDSDDRHHHSYGRKDQWKHGKRGLGRLWPLGGRRMPYLQRRSRLLTILEADRTQDHAAHFRHLISGHLNTAIRTRRRPGTCVIDFVATGAPVFSVCILEPYFVCEVATTNVACLQGNRAHQR